MLLVRVPGLVRVVAVMRRLWRPLRRRQTVDALNSTFTTALMTEPAGATSGAAWKFSSTRSPAVYTLSDKERAANQARFRREISQAERAHVKNERAKQRRRARKAVGLKITGVNLGFDDAAYLQRVELTLQGGTTLAFAVASVDGDSWIEVEP